MMLAGRSKQMPRAQLTAAAAIAKEESKKNMDPSMGDPDLQNRLGIIETKRRGQHKEIKYDNLSKKLEGSSNFLLVF